MIERYLPDWEFGDIFDHPDGDLVRYSDHLAEMKKVEEEMDALKLAVLRYFDAEDEARNEPSDSMEERDAALRELRALLVKNGGAS